MKKLFIVLGLVLLSGCGKDGVNGVNGSVGATGPQGIQGLQGTPGTNGRDGSDAFSWSPVQLCSACTTHYPDTFAEVAFCYQGSLYGTYSANGGFSSRLPSGAYNSNGINCSCTVTIGANCEVVS